MVVSLKDFCFKNFFTRKFGGENAISFEPRKKKTPTFHYTGWLIGILIMVYYNP